MKKLLLTILAVTVSFFAVVSIGFAQAVTPTKPSIVRAKGREIRIKKRLPDNSLAAEQTHTIRGICFQPLRPGQGLDDVQRQLYVERHTDLPILKEMNVNTIRLYSYPSMDEEGLAFLDACYEYGIMVIPTTLVYYSQPNYLDVVRFFKDHPAILAWSFGNEFNYHNMYAYDTATLDECITLLKKAIKQTKAIDKNHPTVICWGDISANDFLHSYYAQLKFGDIFSFNVYRYTSFGNVFSVWEELSKKPMFISEFGVDAYDGRPDQKRENQEAQAYGTRLLTDHMMRNLISLDKTKVCSGGTVFEYTDEWWKYSGEGNSWDVQEAYVSDMPGGGTYPDNFFNEEWWGILDIHRNKREAYYVMQEMYGDIARREAGSENNEITYPYFTTRFLREGNPIVLNGSLKKGETFSVQILTAKGKKAAPDLSVVADEDGVYPLTWNGLDAKGKKVAKGTYVFKIIMGDKKSETEKVFVQ